MDSFRQRGQHLLGQLRARSSSGQPLASASPPQRAHGTTPAPPAPTPPARELVEAKFDPITGERDDTIRGEDRVRIVFSEIDTAREGRVSFESFERGLRQRGFAFTPHAIYELFQKADLDRDGYITQDEWSLWARVYPNTLDAIYHRAPHRRPAQAVRLQQKLQNLEARDAGLGTAGDVADELRRRCKSQEELAEAAAAMIRTLQPLAAFADASQGPHTSPQRQATWATPWGNQQQRVGPDGAAYTWPQWNARFGGPAGWAAAPVVPGTGGSPGHGEMRVGPDGRLYTYPDWTARFGPAGWAEAPVVPGTGGGDCKFGPDGALYSYQDWISRFGSPAGWAAAPPERRISPDGAALTHAEWVRRYGSPANWAAAPLAQPGVRRVGPDGAAVTYPEWVRKYGDPSGWAGAAPLPDAPGSPTAAGPGAAGFGAAPHGPGGAVPALQLGLDGLRRDKEGLRRYQIPAAREEYHRENQKRLQLEAQELKLVEEEVRLERVRDLMRAQENAYEHAERQFNVQAETEGSPRRARRELPNATTPVW